MTALAMREFAKATRRTHSTEPLLDALEPRLRRAFLEVVKRIKDEHTVREIEALLVAGRTDEALAVVNAHAAHLADEIADGYMFAAQDTAEFLRVRGDLLSAVRFDRINVHAVTQIRRMEFRVVQELTREQIAATRAALANGVRDGINPRQQARAFRDSIGLTQRQVQAVDNFRRLLAENPAEALTRALRDRRFDRTVERLLRDGEPLTKKQINRMVQRYRERYLKYRAEVIARTEALAAVHQGSEEMYRQAITSGRLSPDALVRGWVTARDSRRRDSHRAMQGQIRPLGEPFVSGNGNQLSYPGDPSAPLSETAQCRCSITTRVRRVDFPT